MGDFNGEAKHEPNQCGLKLLDFPNYFNLYPLNLMGTCHGPTETYFSHCGRYSSKLDYIFLPNSLSEKIAAAKTFGMHVDNRDLKQTDAATEKRRSHSNRHSI